uniref:Uncharacterized protein n=1 Tax=Guillardia theta TaxID=55529 RepID=A0A7S4ND47_GUITH|mmetsp:Transcript_20419/g.68164  ORF Transcript_20419/g.68164 Transcript_20419/m.68164 type:complete len:224 (+) Transcript_20419:854-1525(+)
MEYGISLTSTVDGGRSWSPPSPLFPLGRHKALKLLPANEHGTRKSQFECIPACLPIYSVAAIGGFSEDSFLIIRSVKGREEEYSIELWRMGDRRFDPDCLPPCSPSPLIQQIPLSCSSEQPGQSVELVETTEGGSALTVQALHDLLSCGPGDEDGGIKVTISTEGDWRLHEASFAAERDGTLTAVVTWNLRKQPHQPGIDSEGHVIIRTLRHKVDHQKTTLSG